MSHLQNPTIWQTNGGSRMRFQSSHSFAASLQGFAGGSHEDAFALRLVALLVALGCPASGIVSAQVPQGVALHCAVQVERGLRALSHPGPFVGTAQIAFLKFAPEWLKAGKAPELKPPPAKP